MTSGWGLVLLDGEDGYYNVADPDETEHGPSCLPGQAASRDRREDAFGREFSGHWVVKPGREVNRTLVTNIMNIPFDTTVHYIAVHLHPFAESLELLDLDTGETVFKSNVEGMQDKIGIKRVEYFSSEEGVAVYKDHQYEMISVYDNTTSENQDSMAVMLLSLLDQKFNPDLPRVPVQQVAGTPRIGDEKLLLHTTSGEITIDLYPDVAPEHVRRILKMARMKIFDGVAFSRLDPGFLLLTGYVKDRSGTPLNAEQQAQIVPLPAEFSTLKHVRGTVSMSLNDNDDPNSADQSFVIMLGDAPHLDEMYTVFGRVAEGFDTLQTLENLPRDGSAFRDRIEILSAEIVQ